MDFTFETQGSNTYLVYTVGPEDTIDTMSLGMLTNNKIPGLAPTQFTQMDTAKYIKYNVTAHVSVRQFFTGAVNKKRLLGVFNGVINAMLSAEEYMIDQHSILMDVDYIFADVSTCETMLICLPIIKAEQKQEDVGRFLKQIMFSTQFDSTEACDYIAKIINYLNSTPAFSLTEFKEILNNIESENRTASVPAALTKQQTSLPIEQQKATSTPDLRKDAQKTNLNLFYADSKAIPQTPAANNINKPQTPVLSSKVLPNNEKIVAPRDSEQPSQKSQVANSSTDEKKDISWLYLMQHYNKENAAAYKAQKEAKRKAADAAKGRSSTAKRTAKKKDSGQPANTFGFAIPGQAAPQPQPAAAAKTGAQPAAQVPNNVNAGAPAVPQGPAAAAQPPAYIPRPAPQGQSANFGETTVLGGGVIGETTVLSAAQNPAQMIAPHLIRLKNNEKISLNKPVFRIGKERSYVDYFVGDNTAVSRSHANFITRDDAYFVVDTNSTNHTFVNGKMIQSNVETKISHGDTIRLANEDFEFRLY